VQPTKQPSRHHLPKLVPAVALVAAAAPSAAQDEIIYENDVDGYASVESYVYPNGTSLESADDFTASGVIDRVWIYGTNCCIIGCSFPTDIIDVTIRFYADDDGFVNVGDLLILLGPWGDCVACAADLDGDDTVDVADLLLLLASWT
jgi:hypothetical protein